MPVVTDHGDGQPGASEPGRVVSRDCEACGRPVTYHGIGRRPRYCTAACRQRAWALRTAARTLTAGADPRPTVLREVVERDRIVEIPAPPPPVPAPPPAAAVPSRGREWTELLDTLRTQLADDRSLVVREHWQHRRLYDALVLAVVDLGRAHPGGLERLRRR